MSFEAMATLLRVAFIREGNYHARLRVTGESDAQLHISIIHESISVLLHDVTGNETSRTILVQDKQSLTIIARRTGLIVGAGVFEVDTSLALDAGILLVPRCTSNLLMEQREVEHFVAAAPRATDSHIHVTHNPTGTFATSLPVEVR